MSQQDQEVAAYTIGAAPKISVPPSLDVELMYGVDWMGHRYSTATVREMTGRDEEAISKVVNKKSVEQRRLSDYALSVLQRCVTHFDGKAPTGNSSSDLPIGLMLEQLIIGDRDLLLLGITRATYGGTRDFDVDCRACNKKNTVEYKLDTDEFPIEGTFVEHGKLANNWFPLTLPRSGEDVHVRYPTSFDVNVAEKVGKDVALQNTAMIAQCVERDKPWDSETDALEWARNLSFADRRVILTGMTDHAPGPQLEVIHVPCGSCGEEIPVALDWASLLLG